MTSIFKNPVSWLFVSLTLGLAPFTPEPQVVGKLGGVLGSGHVGRRLVGFAAAPDPLAAIAICSTGSYSAETGFYRA